MIFQSPFLTLFCSDTKCIRNVRVHCQKCDDCSDRHFIGVYACALCIKHCHEGHRLAASYAISSCRCIHEDPKIIGARKKPEVENDEMDLRTVKTTDKMDFKLKHKTGN